MAKVLLQNLDFPEGPAIDSKGNIWFVELHGGNVCVMSADGEMERYAVANGAPNGIAIDADDRIFFCDSRNNRISILESTHGKISTYCDNVNGEPLAGPNDLAFDSRGNLLFTCPGNSRREATGYVCAVTPEGKVSQIISGKYFPNGLAFSADGATLVLAETYRHRLWRGEWNPQTFSWENAAPWVEVGGKIGPDGMAFGADGNLYAAIYGGGGVKVIAADGQIVRVIATNGANPSNCAFLPNGGLVVTETERGELLLFEDVGGGAELFKPHLKIR